jgi:hypothetical protein
MFLAKFPLLIANCYSETIDARLALLSKGRMSGRALSLCLAALMA